MGIGDSHLITQMQLESVEHGQQKVEIMVADDTGVVFLTCQSMAEEKMDIPKSKGSEGCDLRPIRVIKGISAQSLPCILL